MKSEITTIDYDYLEQLKESVQFHLKIIDQIEGYANRVLNSDCDFDEESVLDYLSNNYPESLDDFLYNHDISVKE